MIKEVIEHYGLEAQLNMTTEVCGELACDCAEILSITAQTGCIDPKRIDYSELTKDMAHVKNAILSVCHLLEIPVSKLENSRESVVEDAVWGKLEQKLLSLSWSCNLLIICCNKFLRASGHGYQIFLSEKRQCVTWLMPRAMSSQTLRDCVHFLAFQKTGSIASSKIQTRLHTN